MAIDATFDSSNTFRLYIERNARYALSLIKASSSQPLPRKKLTISLQALQYTLAQQKLWPFTKQLMLALAPQMELLDLRMLWLPYLKEGLRQSLEHNDREAELALSYYLGNFLREANAYDGAIKHYVRGITLAEEQGNVEMQVRMLNRHAFALRRKGDLLQAEEFASRALDLAENEPIEQGYSYLVLGAVRYDQRRWDECLEYAHRSRDLWLQHNAGHLLAWAYSNLGLALWRRGDLEKAEENLEMAIEYFYGIGDIVHLASTKMNLGGVLFENNKPEKTFILLSDAEKVFRSIQDRRRLAMVSNNLAHVQQAMENWEDALDAFRQSISLWQKLRETSRELNVIHSLISLFIKMKQIENAQKLLHEAQLELASIEGHPDYELLAAEFRRLASRIQTTVN